MKSKLNVEVSFFETVASSTPVTRNLFDLLTDGSFADQVTAVRKERDEDKKKL